jgi:plasmid maintenance system antidote protein VapI
MLTVRDLITAARVAQGLPSNYALANRMQVRERDVSRWFNGHHVPADAMVLRLAELAGLDPAAVLPTIAALRTDDARLRAAWRRAADLAERAAAVAACAILALCVPAILGASAPMAKTGAGPQLGALTVYTLLRILGALVDPARGSVKRPGRDPIWAA